MASSDITYCTKYPCKNMECDRNPRHINWANPCLPYSHAAFTECEFWEAKDPDMKEEKK